MDPRPDSELVALAKRGGREAFAELVRRHHASALAVCRSLLGASPEAEDACQEAFVKAFTGLEAFRGSSSFPTWLHRIAVNACRDRQRASARRPAVSWDELVSRRGEEAAALLGGAEDPRGGLERSELLERALEGLPEGYREALLLREAAGLSYEEIAGAMETTVDAVKARLRRARAQLQERLRHFSPPGGV